MINIKTLITEKEIEKEFFESLKQRIEELSESRDNWKQRANETEQRNEGLIKEMNVLKKQITEKKRISKKRKGI